MPAVPMPESGRAEPEAMITSATTLVRSADAIVSPAGDPMASAKRSLRFYPGRWALGSALALLLAVVPAAPRAEDAPKKVGTERILVEPKPASDSAGTPRATVTNDGTGVRITVTPTVPVPVPAAPVPQTPLPQTPIPAAPAAPTDPAKPLPEVHKGDQDLPAPVARMRQRLLAAAYSGDLMRLRAVMQSNEMPPVLSVNEVADPIEYLKAQSGDGQGLELLAILTDVLESSWVRLAPGTPQEMYVWPAYAALPLDKLEPAQLVELYKIVTSSDLEEMKGVGRYTFYNVGIGPDGTWHWFKLAD